MKTPLRAAIRRLDRTDASAFRALRLEGLLAHPEAFGADYDDERARPPEDFAAMLEGSFVLGGFAAPAKLDGMAGVYLPKERKSRHKAVLWGMYVRPDARGTGLAEALIDGCLEHARTIAEELVLSVGTLNAPAIARYRAAGFAGIGSEKRALKTGGCYYDEILMSVRFAGEETGTASVRARSERNPAESASMSKTSESDPLDPSAAKDAPAPVIPPDPLPRGAQERPMSEDEELDEALDETFPASDPIAPSRIDGPGN